MKTASFITVAALIFGIAGTAAAADLCDVPEAERQSIETLQQKLESEGWAVKKVKVDDGCYEAYATDPEGNKVEAYFDPKTFELVKTKD